MQLVGNYCLANNHDLEGGREGGREESLSKVRRRDLLKKGGLLRDSRLTTPYQLSQINTREVV